MEVTYYPGCTVKNQAQHIEKPALAALRALGVEVRELDRWNCCGVNPSLADDSLMGHLAPTRILIRAQETGRPSLVTLCSMCYNTLARTNILLQGDPEKLQTINSFMDEEADYECGVDVRHYLAFLDREIGWDRVAEQVKKPLSGRRVALYYGCKLQRPREVGIEPPGQFRLMGKLMEALGADVVDFPASDLCCGSYQNLVHIKAASRVQSAIISGAVRAGADLLALSCPLCEFNLNQVQAGDQAPDISIVYFTQLLAEALGVA